VGRELAYFMVPFSTMRRCLQIVKVITTAAYRVDKVAKLFSTGGSRDMWGRLRRAEISLISRDMASVVMSIAAVRLAPDARNPIPLPAIAKAMNIFIQCTSEQEGHASPVTLVMIGSSAAALVLADVSSVLGLKSPSALLEAHELCEGEKYVDVSQKKVVLE
jgi:citrate synthase